MATFRNSLDAHGIEYNEYMFANITTNQLLNTTLPVLELEGRPLYCGIVFESFAIDYKV